MQNFCNVAVVVLIDFRMRFVDLDLDFVEHRFSANEKITRCWVGSPYDRGSAVNLSAELTRGQQKVQDREITSQDNIFGVFDVLVFHVVSVVGPGAVVGERVTLPQLGQKFMEKTKPSSMIKSCRRFSQVASQSTSTNPGTSRAKASCVNCSANSAPLSYSP